MAAFTGPVTVEVPATSANLGPGFDTFGLALGLHDVLTAEVEGDALVIEVTGEGAEEVPRDADHLVVRAMDAAFEALGVSRPGLRLTCFNQIPHARGLGSSSAAIVGGLVLARALVDDGLDRLDDDALLALANRIEGHPDNVAPALLGGFVVAGQGDGEVWAHRVPVDDRIHATAFIPPDGLTTEVARGLLPAEVPHADAAANSSRAALLVVAMTGTPELLLRATEDFLHQGYREPAMPDSLALVRSMRGDGIAAFVSGAGPTVVALTDGPVDLARRTPGGWRCLPLEVDHAGARTATS